jgi:hypothetical protein
VAIVVSLEAAAEALGLSLRQIAYYASGEHEIPRTVRLACKGWEAERHALASDAEYLSRPTPRGDLLRGRRC